MNTIRLFACGDIVATKPSRIKISNELQKLISGADVRVCNFEAPISGYGTPSDKSGPSLNQSSDSPEILKKTGFNVFLLANNHIMDYGAEGCAATKKALSDVITVGAGEKDDAYKIKQMLVRGKKIAFLNVCQYEFGIVEKANEENGYGVAWTHSLDVPEIIKEARLQNDYVFVFPHAGLEDIDAPLPIWRDYYHKLVDWGADAVVASHPHVPQGWERYHDKPIFYSLGNFYFDVLGGNDYWNKGLAIELLLGEKIEFKVHNISFGKDGSIAIDESDPIKNHNNEIQSFLSDKKIYKEYIDKECMKRMPSYLYSTLRGLGGISLSNLSIKMVLRLIVLFLINNKDRITYINIIRCETHRWVYERCLMLKNK